MFPFYHSANSMIVLSSRKKSSPFIVQLSKGQISLMGSVYLQTNFINALLLPHKTSAKPFLHKYEDVQLYVLKKCDENSLFSSYILRDSVRNFLLLFPKDNIII